MSVEEFKAYERYWDNRRNAASTISTAVIEGEFKGKKEGLKQGREIGRQEGLERGIEISMKKIVKNMLSLGNSKAIIAKVTGLTKAQINALITPFRRKFFSVVVRINPIHFIQIIHLSAIFV